MAIAFSRSSARYYTSSAGISLPNSNWCIVIAYKINSMSGSSRQSLFACAPALGETAAKVTIRYHDLSFNTNPGKGTVELNDGTNTRILMSSNSQPTVGVWLLGILQRSGPAKEMWIAEFGNVPTRQATNSSALGAITLSAPCYIAWQDELNYSLEAEIAYLAQGSFALSAEQRLALARGVSPFRVRQDWTRYLPMAAPAATLRPLVGTESYTQTGSPTKVPSPFELF